MDRIFLIQRQPDGLILPDAATIAEAVKYNNWYMGQNDQIILSDSYDHFANLDDAIIPVGSIEFTERWLYKLHGIGTIRPVDITTDILSEFTGRTMRIVELPEQQTEAWNVIEKVYDDLNAQQLFVKQMDRCKSNFLPYTLSRDTATYLMGGHKYLVSEVVDIQSEWRVFVFLGKARGIQIYSGSYRVLPNEDIINEMIEKVTLPSCTIDVAVLKNGRTVLLEVHNFLACGLYGFEDPIIASMTARAFQYEAVRQEDKAISKRKKG